MRVLIRYFFRTLRLILTPFMLLGEKLTTPKAVERSSEAQQRVEQATENLALYQFSACPFCIKVRKEMARLDLPIETRDAQHDERHRADLAAGGGQVKVPCLRIVRENGEDEWLYESETIKQWLQARFEPATA